MILPLKIVCESKYYKRLSKASGHWGMVGGQALDMESEGSQFV